MFEYNARTEVINGAKFIEKDIILFDYSYMGDLLLRVNVSLATSGFGFVIAEDDGEDISLSANIYLIKINSDDSYHIIYKSGTEQSTIDNGFFLSATKVYQDKDVVLHFRKKNEKLFINKAIQQEDGRFDEIPLIEYRMMYDMENYKIGIYSNGGNTVSYAAIFTEAPSNWVSNVFNANGGRIKWIKNGFTIDEAEYDIEVESENIEMKAGKYYFDYKTNNPDMKAYIFKSYRKKTKDENRRTREEISLTRIDEVKDMLKGNDFFELDEDHAINIRFKAKWGTVKDICIKNDRYADFVETSYGVNHRDPGRLLFDLKKIKSVRIKATLESIPYQDLSQDWVYHLFQRGNDTVVLNQDIQFGKEIQYVFTASDGKLMADNKLIATMRTGNILSAFYNVTVNIRELIIVTKEGKEINVLLQKTFKTTLSGEITSPIIVTFKDKKPLELSSSFRKAVTIKKETEIFHAYNPIKLKYYPSLINTNVSIYGIKRGVPLYTNGKLTTDRIKITYSPTKRDLLHGVISLPSDIKLKYYWIVIIYDAIKEEKYIFTPWEREIFNLKENPRIYLENTPLDITGNCIVRGIKSDDYINQDLLYHVPGQTLENSIDLCSYQYTNIPASEYKITTANKINFNTKDAVSEFKYLIVDYLKKDCYAVNQKDAYWEIEISSKENDYLIMYDSKDGLVTTAFQTLSLDDLKLKNKDSLGRQSSNILEEGDFVVLEAGV